MYAVYSLVKLIVTCCCDELGQEGVEQAGPTIGEVSITSLLLAMGGLLL